jgi:bifunctional non-homologous end joining protein LigD
MRRGDGAEDAADGTSVQRGSSKKTRSYRDKRDPLRTNEPFDAEQRRRPKATRAGRFVVHEHDATRRHYDLRIEVGDALKSFAVPKGPSLDPGEKRLAVNTEDHPISYLEFEDVIPEGNYGAGAMIVWDQGSVTYLEGTAEDGIERAKIDFSLSGFKLNGRFGLIHTGKRGKAGEENHWLLVKKEDAHSSTTAELDPRSILSGLRVEELADREKVRAQVRAAAEASGAAQRALEIGSLEPMLCATEGARLDDPERLYELKLDGVRILAERHGQSVSLRYRHGRAATSSYPEIARALSFLPATDFAVDGEIVAFDELGRPSFGRLAPRIHARRAIDVVRAKAEVPVVYLVFDLLALEGRDLTGLPLGQRKELLAQLVRGKGYVRLLDHIEGRGDALFQLCQEQGLEGVVAKRIAAPYRPGPRRSEDWVKLKCERDEEFVVVGWDAGRGGRGALGALVVASYESGDLVVRGKVGSGLSRALIAELTTHFERLASDTPTATGFELLGPGATEVQHVRPELVVGVRFTEWTSAGSLRHPVLRGLRDDIVPSACRALPSRGDDPVIVEPAPTEVSGRVAVSNRDKVFFPEDGITKGDLVDYYASVAPTMLPFLKDRPVVLVRYPDGIHGKSFYQWRTPEGTPEWISTLELRDDEDVEHRGEKSVFLVDDVDSLVHIANLGAIPIHVLASSKQDLECGAFFTMDFDVKLASLREAVTLALALRELLEGVGLRGYPKTSGKTGLHVLVPVGPGVPFDVTRALAELFGGLLAAAHPKIATMERRVADRGARVYVDTGQTGRSRTIVAPYSVREIQGARVSTPLDWAEVSAALDPAAYTLHTVPLRLTERSDPMAEFFEQRPNIVAVLEALEAKVRG